MHLHHIWWMRRFPHHAGDFEGYHANWWKYNLRLGKISQLKRRFFAFSCRFFFIFFISGKSVPAEANRTCLRHPCFY